LENKGVYVMKKITIAISIVCLFYISLTFGAFIKLVDGTEARVKVILLTDKGANVQAEGLEPVWLDASDIEVIVIDETIPLAGVGNGILFANGLRTYAPQFEITEDKGTFQTVHGVINVGGFKDVRSINYKRFATHPTPPSLKRKTKYTNLSSIPSGRKTAVTADDIVFEYETVQFANGAYLFRWGTITHVASVEVIREITMYAKEMEKHPSLINASDGTTFKCRVLDFKGETVFDQVKSFGTCSKITVRLGTTLSLYGTIGKTADGKPQLIGVTSNVPINLVRIQINDIA